MSRLTQIVVHCDDVRLIYTILSSVLVIGDLNVVNCSSRLPEASLEVKGADSDEDVCDAILLYLARHMQTASVAPRPGVLQTIHWFLGMHEGIYRLVLLTLIVNQGSSILSARL